MFIYLVKSSKYKYSSLIKLYSLGIIQIYLTNNLEFHLA